MKFWDALAEKGKIATIIGFLLGLGATVTMIIVLVKNSDFKYLPYAFAFGFSLFFFILPSSFILTYKDFKIEVKE